MTVSDMAADRDDSVPLKNLVPLNALSDEVLGRLSSRISVEKLAPGEFLFREGDTDNQNVYLLEGKVALLSGGREVDSIISGSNTARFALAHQWPRKFSARAVGRVQCVRIDSRMLSDLLVRTQTQSYRVSELEADGDGDWMSQVLRSRLFQRIPAANIQNLLRRMEQVMATKGEVIIRQGDEGDYYYVIIQGSCSVTRTQEGHTAELARLGPGDSFGEQALLSDAPRTSSITMVTDGMLARLGREDFTQLIQSSMARSVGFRAAQKRAEAGAQWLDLRAAERFAQGHPPGALNLPLEQLRERSPELDPEREYLVYGDDSGQGAIGAFLLLERDLDAYSLEGGAASLPAAALEAAATPAAATDESPPPPDEPAEPDLSEAARERRVEDLEESLRQTQERFQKALYQRIGELRQARQSLEEAKSENTRLLEGQRELERERDDLLQERDTLKRTAEELERELDDVQEVLQEASAEESAHQWEKTRWEERQKRLEQALEEERNVNRVLRQEGEETQRRMEALRTELERRQT